MNHTMTKCIKPAAIFDTVKISFVVKTGLSETTVVQDRDLPETRMNKTFRSKNESRLRHKTGSRPI